MYWVGGPKNFRIWEFANGKERQFLGKPTHRSHFYTYFPTVTPDNRWLAYGASPGQHSHSTSDYEIFLQELKDWRPVGQPVRLTWNNRTDRWPCLYRGTSAPKTVVEKPGKSLAAIPRPSNSGDALEIGGPWTGIGWGNEVSVGEVKIGAAGTRVLRLACQSGEKEKAAASRPVRINLPMQGRAVLSVYNPGKTKTKIALAVVASDKRVYFESVMKETRPGAWRRIEFDLASSDWKCAASGWDHKSPLTMRKDVREIILLVYSEKKSATLYVDDLEIIEGTHAELVF